MFTHLRKSGGTILTRIMLLCIVLSFCLWGIGDIFRSAGTDSSVAKVGSASISMQEYQRALRNRMQEYRERMGKDYNADLIKKLGVGRQALDSIINRVVLEQEAEALGIIVGEDDVADNIAHNVEFQDSKGQFSKEAYLAVLANNHISESQYIASLQSELATKLLLGIVTADITAPDDMVDAVYRARHEKRIAGLLLIPRSTVAQQGEPSAKDLKAYYDAHTDAFLVPEYRTISYVELKEDDVRPSVQVSEAEIQKAYEERAEEFHLKERRVLEQMVFEKKADAEKAAAALASGKSFADVAKSSPATNKDKLQLGELTKDAVPVAGDEVFALKEGGFTKPSESAFGWHILHVVKIVPAGERPLAEVHDQIARDIASKAAGEAVYKLSRTFEDAMGGGATLEEGAQKVGQKVQTVANISREGLTENGSKPALPQLSNFTELAFSTAEKDHSRLVEGDNGSFVMVRVDSIKHEHTRPMEEVLQEVKDAVKKEQTGQQLQKLAQEIDKALQSGKTLEEALAGKNIKPLLETSGPLLRTTDVVDSGKLKGTLLPRELIAELFNIKQHAYTHAHLQPSGGYIIALLEQIVPVSAAEKAADADGVKLVREEVTQSLEKQVQHGYFQYLRTKYPVTIRKSVMDTEATSEE